MDQDSTLKVYFSNRCSVPNDFLHPLVSLLLLFVANPESSFYFAVHLGESICIREVSDSANQPKFQREGDQKDLIAKAAGALRMFQSVLQHEQNSN